MMQWKANTGISGRALRMIRSSSIRRSVSACSRLCSREGISPPYRSMSILSTNPSASRHASSRNASSAPYSAGSFLSPSFGGHTTVSSGESNSREGNFALQGRSSSGRSTIFFIAILSIAC